MKGIGLISAGYFPQVVALLVGFGLGSRGSPAAVRYQRLRSFGSLPVDPQEPCAALLLASDGVLYGTTSTGGSGHQGTIFRLNRDGADYRDLHSFTGLGGDGVNGAGNGMARNEAALIEGRNGVLYGTTASGGAVGLGTLFTLNKDGSGFTILHSFGKDSGDGASPHAGLIEGTDGRLYGTTQVGGQFGTNHYNGGTVFTLEMDGGHYTVLHSFNGAGRDGEFPTWQIVEGQDGALYGTTESGGRNLSAAWGTIFKMNKDGSGYQILRSLSRSGGDGFDPGPLVQWSDGTLYGTTFNGPVAADDTSGAGTLFKLNPDGTGYQILRSFSWATGGGLPIGVTQGKDGALYLCSDAVLTRITQGAGADVILHSFPEASPGDGYWVAAPVVRDSDGVLYGTTSGGGTDAVGTVFRIDEDGTGYRILHSFSDSDFDGRYPQAPLIQASDGAFYGTTTRGGAYLGMYDRAGAVFKLSADGSRYGIIHNFGATPSDGQIPMSGLTEGNDGALYGTTQQGGNSTSGTVYRLNKDGSAYQVLHSFGDPADDGSGPESGLIEGDDGALYGTAHGGSTEGGIIFTLAKDGSGYRVLFNFAMTGGGSRFPRGLIKGRDGALYGVTRFGGTTNINNSQGFGTVFRLNRDGSGYAVLHTFQNAFVYPNELIQAADGALYVSTGVGPSDVSGIFKLNPDGSGYQMVHSFQASASSRLVQTSDGTLYGTTTADFDIPAGNMFRISPAGTGFQVLYAFQRRNGEGSQLSSGLVKGRDGAFYGTSSDGGDLGYGTLFRILPPETPGLLILGTTASGAEVITAGAAGKAYQLLRSTDLIHWSSIKTFAMPAAGIVTNLDAVPITGNVYYRAAWIP